jgi:nucleotide-binding universal stress UspA family protein
MRWVVGVDVGKGWHGALGLAAWAAGQARPGVGDLVAVHVLEAEHLRVVLRLHHLDEVTAEARRVTGETLARHRLDTPVEIVQAIEASDGLATAAARLAADAIVIGRHAGMDGSGLGRLGRIARLSLHELTGPVIVAPHDLTPESVGKGPILALSSLGDDSVEAVRFARRLATWLGRELVVAHSAERPPEGHQALAAWMASTGVRADRLQEVEGPVLTSAPRLARDLQAPVLVTGSRMLSGIDRRLHASIGSELAASAPVAVAVVPPPP